MRSLLWIRCFLAYNRKVISKEHILQIVDAGIRAPSGENSQPWRFTVRGDMTLEIFNVPEKDTSLYNLNQRGSMVAHGALIENIAITSLSLGYKAKIALFPEAQAGNLVARITFDATAPQHDALADAITKRSTNRKLYHSTPLTGAERQALVSTALGGLILLEQPETIAKLAKAISTNERILFENRLLHDYFFDHVRWTREEERDRAGGFYFKTLEINAPLPLFRLLRKWPAMNFFNKLGMSKKISQENEKVFASAPALGALVMQGNTSTDYLNAGRIFERLWLTATNLGLSLQPMTGVVYLHENIRQGQPGPLNSDEQRSITMAFETVTHLMKTPQGTISVLFRLGHADPPSSVSSRVATEKTIVFDSPSY